MRRMLLSVGVLALLATGSVASARQSETLIGDAKKAADVKVSALADYVSMVALAPVKPGVVNGASILRLFDGPGAPQAMTERDRACLRAVYRRGTD